MESKELNKKLIAFFSELKEVYIDEVDWQEGDDTGAHTLYGDVFTPFLVSNIENHNMPIIERAFSFIEKLLSLDDSYADDVISVSVLESVNRLVKDNSPMLDSFIGEKSKSILAAF